ncbi:hypothetical protein [Paenibacillus sp. LjRoot56]
MKYGNNYWEYWRELFRIFGPTNEKYGKEASRLLEARREVEESIS